MSNIFSIPIESLNHSMEPFIDFYDQLRSRTIINIIFINFIAYQRVR